MCRPLLDNHPILAKRNTLLMDAPGQLIFLRPQPLNLVGGISEQSNWYRAVLDRPID